MSVYLQQSCKMYQNLEEIFYGETPPRGEARPRALSLRDVCASQHDPIEDRDDSCAHSSTLRPSLHTL